MIKNLVPHTTPVVIPRDMLTSHHLGFYNKVKATKPQWSLLWMTVTGIRETNTESITWSTVLIIHNWKMFQKIFDVFNTSSTLVFPTVTLSFVSKNPFLKKKLVVAAAEIKRSCMACLVDGCCRSDHRLLTTDPTFSATSPTFPLASLATSPTNDPADCPASFNFTPVSNISYQTYKSKR